MRNVLYTVPSRLVGCRHRFRQHGRGRKLDTPTGLKRMINRNGHEPSLEEVFMDLTGKELVEKDDLTDFELQKVLD